MPRRENITTTFLTATLILVSVLGVQAADKPNSASNPVPGIWPNPSEWMQRHKGFVAIAKQGGVDLLFLGDSITDFWRQDTPLPPHLPEGGGKKVWDKNFASLKAANFGSCGECTQHVLWRVQNGELDGITPKWIVLLIGINNTTPLGPKNTNEEIAEGIKAITKNIHDKTPATKILLFGLFPLAEQHHASMPPARIKQINSLLAQLDDGGKTVQFMDIGDKFLEADPTLKSVMPDGVHPNAKGYQIWADAILPAVREARLVQ